MISTIPQSRIVRKCSLHYTFRIYLDGTKKLTQHDTKYTLPYSCFLSLYGIYGPGHSSSWQWTNP